MALPAAGTKPPERQTIRPNGVPTWPCLLCAGLEKKGKTWWALEGSGSDLIGHTYYVECGEGQAHEYGAIPGADYEIVPHDGTYRDIYNSVWWAVTQEWVDGKPNLVVFDSATVLWDMIVAELQEVANRRAKKKGKAVDPDNPPDITTDLWNVGKQRWHGVIDLLRFYKGPSLITSRLEEVMVMRNGQPTTEKMWKVKAEKTLPYEVDGIIEFKELYSPVLTGIRSARLQVPDNGLSMKGMSVHDLYTNLGLADLVEATADRTHVQINASAGADEIEAQENGEQGPEQADPKQEAAQRMANEALAATDLEQIRSLYNDANSKQILSRPVTVPGKQGPTQVSLRECLKVLGDRLAPAAPPAETPPAEAAPADAGKFQRTPETDAAGKPWLDEIKLMAEILDVDASDFAKALLDQAKVTDPREIPVETVRAWVFTKRPQAVAALREQNLDVAADVYGKHAKERANEPVTEVEVFPTDQDAPDAQDKAAQPVTADL